MRTLKCLISVPDKYTKAKYEEGKTYNFDDERAEEILSARTKVTNEPYFEEYAEVTEEEVQAVASAIVEQAEEDNKPVEEVITDIIKESEEVEPTEEKPVEEVVEEKTKTRKKKTKKDNQSAE